MRLPDIYPNSRARPPKRLSALQMLVQRSYELEALPLPTPFARGPQQAVEPSLTMPEAQGETPPAAADSAQRVDERGANVEQSQVVSDRRRATDNQQPDALTQMSEAIAELRAEIGRMKSAAVEPMRFSAVKDGNGRWDIRTVGNDT